jgi:hypothetical protein
VERTGGNGTISLLGGKRFRFRRKILMAAKLRNDRLVENAKPKDKPYRLADGDSLYLLVLPTG